MYLCFSRSFDFFFVKQKTAYEMRISDWSSDVCSSDLRNGGLQRGAAQGRSVFQQDRVLLLHRAEAGAGPGGTDAGDVLRRSGNRKGPEPRRCEDDHAVLHLFRGGGSGRKADQRRTGGRSEERREGKECVGPCRSRRSPFP